MIYNLDWTFTYGWIDLFAMPPFQDILNMQKEKIWYYYIKIIKFKI